MYSQNLIVLLNNNSLGMQYFQRKEREDKDKIEWILNVIDKDRVMVRYTMLLNFFIKKINILRKRLLSSFNFNKFNIFTNEII